MTRRIELVKKGGPVAQRGGKRVVRACECEGMAALLPSVFHAPCGCSLAAQTNWSQSWYALGCISCGRVTPAADQYPEQVFIRRCLDWSR